MENAQQQIQLFHICFIVCMVIMIVALVLAVLFFFVFDIRTNFAIRTGRAQQISVQRMTENNAKTGTLRKKIDMDYTTTNLKRYETVTELNKDQGSEETSQLGSGAPAPQQTPVQAAAAPVQNVAAAAAPMQPIMAPQEPVIPAGFNFRIIENIMVIHTNELI